MTRLRRGINLGGVLDRDAPAPGLRLSADHLSLIRDAGFDTVRLPVKWISDHARVSSDRERDERLTQTDEILGWAHDCDLNVVLTVHHFDRICDDLAGMTPVLLDLWREIAARYRSVDESLHLELLNEPHPPMTAEQWNALLPRVLTTVRHTDPTRPVLVGPVHWNTVGALPALRLPDDPHLVVTIHYYSPFRFTHQGAPWLPGAHRWRGTRWGTEAEQERVHRDLAEAAAWADERGFPLVLGEFGTYRDAPPADRVAWTATVRRTAEALGIPWVYWDFATDFGAYDAKRYAWREPLRAALLGE